MDIMLPNGVEERLNGLGKRLFNDRLYDKLKVEKRLLLQAEDDLRKSLSNQHGGTRKKVRYVSYEHVPG